MYRNDHFKVQPELRPIRGPRWDRKRAERAAAKEVASDLDWMLNLDDLS